MLSGGSGGASQIRLRQIINTSSRTDADKSQALASGAGNGEGGGAAERAEAQVQEIWNALGISGKWAAKTQPRRIESIKFKLVLGNHCGGLGSRSKLCVCVCAFV